jgi:hypothetical protein
MDGFWIIGFVKTSTDRAGAKILLYEKFLSRQRLKFRGTRYSCTTLVRRNLFRTPIAQSLTSTA